MCDVRRLNDSAWSGHETGQLQSGNVFSQLVRSTACRQSRVMDNTKVNDAKRRRQR